jgi:hypothetical protein
MGQHPCRRANTSAQPITIAKADNMHLHHNNDLFLQAEWENLPIPERKKTLQQYKRQPVLLQLADEPNNFILRGSAVKPELSGSTAGVVLLHLELAGLHISPYKDVGKHTIAILQLDVHQFKKDDGTTGDVCSLVGGFPLFNSVNQRKALSKQFRQNLTAHVPNCSIPLPSGIAAIGVRLFLYEGALGWPQLLSSSAAGSAASGFICAMETHKANQLSSNLMSPHAKVLEGLPVQVAFTKSAKRLLNGGLDYTPVVSLNAGYWVITNACNYQELITSKPMFYPEFGLLGPGSESEQLSAELIEKENGDNPLTLLSYLVLKAKLVRTA